MRFIILIFAAVFSVCLIAGFSFSQEDVSAGPAAPVLSEEVAIYGEVQAVDVTSGLLKVKYYDYDADDEKVIDIYVGKDTKMENIASLSGIKTGDWVDAAYSVLDGKNIAKTVVKELEEETPAGLDEEEGLKEVEEVTV